MSSPSTRLVATAAAAALALAGCSSGNQSVNGTAAEPDLGSALASLNSGTSDVTAGASTNGMSANGMSANGVSANGMSANGMSANGMSANGLTAATLGTLGFGVWFNLAPKLNDLVMKYTVRCAAPAGTTFTYYSPVTKVTYSWAGNLGVAPGWVSGHAITTAEQQLVSACLAAHVNKFGISMAIAVEGRTAAGVTIPYTSTELSTYSVREACFFGNLFTGEGIYAGVDHGTWAASKSTPRACAFDTRAIGTDNSCPPIFLAGYCSQLCVPDGVGYLTCSYGGKSYKALVTRISTSEISTCGDGVCAPQEQCGTGTSWDSCQADCGVCSSSSQ